MSSSGSISTMRIWVGPRVPIDPSLVCVVRTLIIIVCLLSPLSQPETMASTERVSRVAIVKGSVSPDPLRRGAH